MKALILLLFTLFFSSQVFAETLLIDERKTDIYFANGVGAGTHDASFEQGYKYIEGSKNIERYKKVNPEIKPYIGKYDLAFNTGRGLLMDYFSLVFSDS